MKATTRSDGLTGLALAVASSAAFALSGPLARGLIDTGWSPIAAVTVRTWGAFFILLLPALAVLGGRWDLVRSESSRIVWFGLLAVSGAQLCFFSAVAAMPVAVALLIEYTAPIAILVWLWVLQDQRPTRLTLIGAALAILGLIAVLGVLDGVTVSLTGLFWSLGAMVGAAGYFLLSAHGRSELPPLVLATGGIGVGAVVLSLVAVTGLQSFSAARADASIGGGNLPWWVTALLLALVTAALAYALGVTAARLLGARLMSFVALTEVLFAALFAWLLLGESVRVVQIGGGLLVLLGIGAVRLGEPSAPQSMLELPVTEPRQDVSRTSLLS